MSLSLSESQAITEIARLFYDFLPGNPHPYADQSLSFQGIALDLSLTQFWPGGSKLSSTTTLLEKTLEIKRDVFCKLIYSIVRRGLNYRTTKGNPIMREEIKYLNDLILKIKFKIPELWDPSFLNSLPSKEKQEYEKKKTQLKVSLEELRKDFLDLNNLAGQKRGYEFEKFLKRLFDFYNLDSHASFRLVGEQIDGSFQFQNETYLVEAKWQNLQVSQSDLLIFQGKVEGKAKWSRGLFISYSGFTDDGLIAFSHGRSTNVIGMTGQDLYFIFEGKMLLTDAIEKKSRRAAETGQFYTSVFEL